MPRLRYLKEYTPIEVEYEDSNEIENNGSGISGSSWLSNATIIGTMSEAKIKQKMKKI